MTHIVQLQYSKESAGSSALRLHNAFNQDGRIDSTILSMNTDHNISKKIRFLGNSSRIISKLDTKLKIYINRKNIKRFGLFSYPVLGTNISYESEIKNADAIYLHWVLGGFLNFSGIAQLARLKKPVIVVMHDMWYLTGGCHYSFTCEKYVTGCGNCPIFPSEKEKDLSFKGFNKKSKLFTKFDNLYFVSPSRWLYECAKKSLLLKNKPVFYIPNAIDNTLYKSIDKTVAKQILGIDINEKVVAFGAVSVNSPYKGWTYLQKALEILKGNNEIENISILIFGSGYDKTIAESIPFKIKFLGYLKDDYSVMVAFNAADVFVVPSLADNQPTTVMESMCCGTPVVGFNIGGIPDMIVHKRNGYLADYKNSESISNGIKYCIKNEIKGGILPGFQASLVVQKHIDLLNIIKKKGEDYNYE